MSVVVGAAGNVGIGTTNPTSKLDIGVAYGDDVVGLNIYQNDTLNNPDAISITQNGSGNALQLISNSPTAVMFNAYTNQVRTSGVLFNLNDANSGSSSSVFNITANGSGTALNIDGTGTGYSALFNNGNVGIGTSGPTAKLDINSDIIRLRTAKTPATAGASGNAGDVCWDASYIYVCVATNTWKRSTIATW